MKAPADAEGHLYRVSTTAPEVYWIDGGTRRHVPDPATLLGIFVDGVNVDVDADAANWDTGLEIPCGAVLTKAPERPEVYLIDQVEQDGPAVRRHVASPAAAAKYNLGLDKVRLAPTGFMLFDGITESAQIG